MCGLGNWVDNWRIYAQNYPDFNLQFCIFLPLAFIPFFPNDVSFNNSPKLDFGASYCILSILYFSFHLLQSEYDFSSLI